MNYNALTNDLKAGIIGLQEQKKDCKAANEFIELTEAQKINNIKHYNNKANILYGDITRYCEKEGLECDNQSLLNALFF